MQHKTPRHILAVIGGALAISIISLWSWNTLAVLFDAPAAQFKHALAFLALLMIVRLAVWPQRYARARRTCSHCEQIS